MALNDKQRLFCHSLLKHKFNQTKAYKETYPDSSDESARRAASDLLTNVDVRQYVQKLKTELEESEIIEIIDIVKDIIKIKEDNMSENPQVALKALELLGKYKKMFTENIDIKGDGTFTINHVYEGEKNI